MTPNNSRSAYQTIRSILGIIVFIIVFIFGIYLVSTLIIIGALLGLVLFITGYIRVKILKRRSQHHAPFDDTNKSTNEHIGRTFDQDEFK